jgi:MYXO-CTERM domain-containing protein
MSSRILFSALVAVLAVPSTALAGDDISNIIYVNRCEGGCTIIPGGTQNDARSDISSIPEQESIVSEFAHSQQVWDDVVQCIRETYEPFDVVVTTEDPGPTTLHHEAILAGSPGDLGLSDQIGGIAPGGGCGPQNNVISFSFANTYSPSSVFEMCATVAQESAHAFGLDHEFDCRDPMTYLFGCGQKFFRNELIECGEFNARPCYCSGNVQNSHVLLRGVFGEGTLPPPPVVNIITPSADDSVSGSYSVWAEASDKRGVSRVELRINNWTYDEQDGHSQFQQEDPYNFQTPANVPDGVQNIEIIAYNDLEVAGTATVSVIKGSPCSDESTCNDGQSCDAGACMWPDATGVQGDPCVRDMDCESAMCANDGTEAYCSESCFPGINNTCGDGFDCLDTGGGTGACWPGDGDDGGGGGCCSVGDDSAPSPGQLALFGLVAGFLYIRRRRSTRTR